MKLPDRRTVAVVALAAAAAWLVSGSGAFPVVVVIAVLASSEGLERASRHLALAASCSFMAAVVLTVLEDPLEGEPSLRFALDRPAASSLGTLAGALLLSAVVLGLGAARRPAET